MLELSCFFVVEIALRENMVEVRLVVLNGCQFCLSRGNVKEVGFEPLGTLYCSAVKGSSSVSSIHDLFLGNKSVSVDEYRGLIPSC